MRLDRLHIAAYGNLRDFEIDFDEGQPTTVLIGRNGSGKSYLIEAIVEIFRDLELDRAPCFAYTLDYVCRERKIRIDADPSRSTKRLEITVDGKALTRTAFRRDLDRLLPNYVFAYYSGWSERLQRQFDKPTQKYYNDVLYSLRTDMPLRRLFFCRKEYSQLVLLAFFLAEPENTRYLLEKYLNIKGFDSALFVLKTPWWRGSGRPNKKQLADGDERFWYASGTFKGFLSRIWDQALAPIRNTEVDDHDIRRQGDRIERLYLFIKNQAELSGLKDADQDAKTLFSHLESLFLCDLIDEVRVTVVRTDDTPVKFTQLSEGEQQLLTVLGLLLFTQDDESLYLLDEPDTHLNPLWTYEYLSLLQDNIRAEKVQLLITTHNPLMIGTLHRNQVRNLRQEGRSILAEEPEDNPIGIGIEGLLKSELYGLRSTLAPEILRDIDTQNELLALPRRNAAQKKELENASERLDKLGVTRSHPNPLFDLFAKAIAGEPLFQKPVLTKDEIKEQEKLGNEMIEKIMRESE